MSHRIEIDDPSLSPSQRVIQARQNRERIHDTEREVIAAAEKFYDAFDHQQWTEAVDALIDAVAKLREARGK